MRTEHPLREQEVIVLLVENKIHLIREKTLQNRYLETNFDGRHKIKWYNMAIFRRRMQYIIKPRRFTLLNDVLINTLIRIT